MDESRGGSGLGGSVGLVGFGGSVEVGMGMG